MRQHEAVDAGRPYHQLQEAGIRTAHLEEIVRQRDPELKAIVEQLSREDGPGAVERLDRQGRVHEIGPHAERLTAIANEYVKDRTRRSWSRRTISRGKILAAGLFSAGHGR